MLKLLMEVSKDLEDEINPFLSINVTDVEEAGNEIFILVKDEGDDELINIDEIWKDNLLSNLFIFCIVIFMSYDYVEESFYK